MPGHKHECATYCWCTSRQHAASPSEAISRNHEERVRTRSRPSGEVEDTGLKIRDQGCGRSSSGGGGSSGVLVAALAVAAAAAACCPTAQG